MTDQRSYQSLVAPFVLRPDGAKLALFAPDSGGLRLFHNRYWLTRAKVI
jgi:hypothetical protein